MGKHGSPTKNAIQVGGRHFEMVSNERLDGFHKADWRERGLSSQHQFIARPGVGGGRSAKGSVGWRRCWSGSLCWRRMQQRVSRVSRSGRGQWRLFAIGGSAVAVAQTDGGFTEEGAIQVETENSNALCDELCALRRGGWGAAEKKVQERGGLRRYSQKGVSWEGSASCW